jgi:hypothetical protein
MPTVNHPLVGRVRFEIIGGRDGRIRLLDNFEGQNLETVEIPQLRGKPLFETDGDPFSGRVRWHKRGKTQLEKAWQTVEREGLLNLVLTFDGAFFARLVRGSTSSPSNHSFGTAFDINASWNGLGRRPAALGARGSVRRLVPIFENHGFKWGGDFSRPDGMHFELERFGDVPVEEEEDDESHAVTVFLNDIQVPVPAFLATSDGELTLFVGVRALTGQLGGTLSDINSQPVFSLTVTANRAATLVGRVVDGTGFVRFIDLLPLYDGVTREFDLAQRILRIRR